MGFFHPAILLVVAASVPDIFANICVAASRGFTRIWYAVLAYVLVGLAFYLLSISVHYMDLAVAYAMWGAFGIIGTVTGGWIAFGQKPGLLAWVGMGVLIVGIILLH